MPVDKWGIPFFYPTAKDAGVSGEGQGFFWQQNNDIFEDNEDGMVRLGKELDDVEVINSSTGEWEFPFDSGADYFCLEVRQGHKSGGETHGCEGSCYIFNVTINDSPPQFYFQKQLYHGGSKFTDPITGTFTHASATEEVVGGGWKGLCAVIYNKKDGRSAGHDSAILEIWWNEDPANDIDNWVMVKRTEDKGGWGNDGDSCDGADDQVITWSNIQFRYKSGTPDFSLHPLIPEFEDGPVIHSIGGADMSFEDSENRGYGKREDMPANVEMKCLFKFDENDGICRLKNLSLREIDPLLSFDDNPDTPPEPPTNTTTVQGLLTFKQDINTVRGASQCAGTGLGGGGGSGNTVFFTKTPDFDKELSNSTTWSYRTRVAEQVVTTSSILNGKLIKQLDVWLKKVGTPTTPDVKTRIWNSSGNIIYESLTTLDPSTLSTSYTKNSFDFSTNTHVMVPGDRIGVEWTGTSASSYVVAGYQEDPNTASIYNSWHIDEANWSTVTTRDFACDIWE